MSEIAWNKYRFGNIKLIDRQRIFPISRIEEYEPAHLPWTNFNVSKPLWSTLISTTDAVKAAIQYDDYEMEVEIPLVMNMKVSIINPRGLLNHGNMCFMNSILQPLLYSSPFYQTLLSIPGPHPPILKSMLRFFAQFKTDCEPDELRDIAFSCEYVYDAIRSETKIDSLRGRQEDAQEFLGFLLDGLHEELVDLHGRVEIDNSDWTEIGKKKNTKVSSTEIQESEVTKIFGGKFRSTVTSGSSVSVTKEPFTSVSLDISSVEIKTIEQAFVQIARREVIEDFASQHTTKQIEFDRLPVILIICLKRFVYDESRGTLKIDKHISYPVLLELPRQACSLEQREYKLYGVVNHHGQYAQGGHYTCDIFTDKWRRFDDSEVRDVEESIVLGKQSDRQPYMLFYIKQ